MNRGQMTSAMMCFIDAIRHWLVDGHRVETPLGVFAPKLKLNGRFTDPKAVRNSDVSLDGIDFTPSKEFVGEVQDMLYYGFRRASTRFGNKQMYDDAKLERALEKCHAAYGAITIRGFQDWSGLRYASAKKHLSPTLPVPFSCFASIFCVYGYLAVPTDGIGIGWFHYSKQEG